MIRFSQLFYVLQSRVLLPYSYSLQGTDTGDDNMDTSADEPAASQPAASTSSKAEPAKPAEKEEEQEDVDPELAAKKVRFERASCWQCKNYHQALKQHVCTPTPSLHTTERGRQAEGRGHQGLLEEGFPDCFGAVSQGG